METMATVAPHTSSPKKTHPFQTDDARLRPIHDKVMAQERLSEDDALALYRSGDILAVGWLANHVRERMHGDTAYFNVNRHINYTNVCVAACRLCAFGRKKDTPGAYTMALEEAWQTAASGYTEAVTEFHIVGGLHADLPFQYYLDLIAGIEGALSAGAPEGLHHGRDRLLRQDRQDHAARGAGQAERGRARFPARRRRGDFLRSRAPHHLRSQD